MIELSKIYKKYENNADYSVNDFNLEIEEGEFIVFVGPSGCGKSTTLRMVAGLEEISEGEFKIDGKLVNEVHPKDRNIAMVFQDYALYPHMTVEENMGFGLKVQKYDKKEIKKRVIDAAEIVGLRDFLKKKPGNLSGGQRQRVALGRAIVRHPKLFLMDEPLSNLDAKLRVTMRVEITKLVKNLGVTTIYVTHDQVEAMTMADRIVVMSNGWVQQIGSPTYIYDNPKNLFVAKFIGQPQMNIIPAKFTSKGVMINNVEHNLTAGVIKKLGGKFVDGKEIFIGIRPEHIHTEAIHLDSGLDNIMKLEMEKSHFENMGNEIILYLKYNNNDVIAKVPRRDEKKLTSSSVEVGLDLNNAHFFDAETEENMIFEDEK